MGDEMVYCSGCNLVKRGGCAETLCTKKKELRSRCEEAVATRISVGYSAQWETFRDIDGITIVLRGETLGTVGDGTGINTMDARFVTTNGIWITKIEKMPKCDTCQGVFLRHLLNGRGECGTCCRARLDRAEARISRMQKDMGEVHKGDTVHIEVKGRRYIGTVITASNWKGSSGWYIEFFHTKQSEGSGYGYWKQGSDGGYLDKVIRATPAKVEPEFVEEEIVVNLEPAFVVVVEEETD